jgi:hypothetical protein
LTGRRGFSKLDRRQKVQNQAEELSPLGSSPLPDLQSQNQYGGETKGIPMNHPIRLKTIAPRLLITLALLCFALLPRVQAVVPAPDGGYANFNTAEGQNALFSLTTGAANTAVGWFSLESTTTSNFNTALGAGTLLSNVAESNTAIGAGALLFNTTGEANTAAGTQALFSNDTGSANAATGDGALYSNIEGSNNTATGTAALFFNTGSRNTANGRSALFDNTSGGDNTATGYSALHNNTTGSFNTATGTDALLNSATGTHNTALGYFAGSDVTGTGNVCIGANVYGDAGVNDTTWVKNVYASVATARQVYVNSDNKIGTLVSSRRFKEEIQPMEKASEAILALKPVTFHYKKEIEPNGSIMFGLIAEEVEQVDPDLVNRNDQGEAEAVRYEAVNAMLLNEFLKEHRKNEEQQAIIMQLKSTDAKQEAIIAKQQRQIEALAASLQKVSAQLEVNKPAPQIVLNNQ